MTKLFIQGPYGVDEMRMFINLGWKKANTIEEADAVCWTGGEDVDPALYDEAPLPRTFFSPERDEKDIEAYSKCDGKFKIGICRGGQFLNVMNKGKLWQHVDKHGETHSVRDYSTGAMYRVSSTHHQQMRPGPGGIVVAATMRSTFKACDGFEWQMGKPVNINSIADKVITQDVEVVWYPQTKSLCFQPHPEYQGYQECTDYFFKLIDRYYK